MKHHPMKKLMHFMFLSCIKATELIEKKLFIGLSIREKVQLMLHKSMCDACTRYGKQSEELDHYLQKNVKIFTPSQSKDSLTLSEESKQKLIENIQ